MAEHEIMNEIRLAVSTAFDAPVFRANVGSGFAGSSWAYAPDGGVYLENPRRFSTGLPVGFSDLFGVLPGGRAFFIECKRPGGRTSPEQERFIAQMRKQGAIACVAHSGKEAVELIQKEVGAIAGRNDV